MKSPLFIKKLIPEAIIPKKGSALAAGYDLHAVSALTIQPHDKGIVKTGLVNFITLGNKSTIWKLWTCCSKIRISC